MNDKKILKRSIGLFLALTLAIDVSAFAEEVSCDAQVTPAQVESAVATTQPPQQSTPIATPAKTVADQAADEATPPPESTAPSADKDDNEADMDSPPETGEPGAPSPTEDKADENAEDDINEDALVELQPESIAVSITLKWDISTDDDLLRVGDPITLTAEITTEAANLNLQWQVATKPAQDLAEDEPEWANLSGKIGTKYTFTVQEGMQSWRWRLCVTTPDGGAVYSEEMRLPKLTTAEDESVLLDDSDIPLGVASIPPLPTATIILTANIPLDEIVFGDEVTLAAEIHNPREDMQLQWQYIPSNTEPAEEAWLSIAGATESRYTYIVDEGNESRLWRLLITVPEDILTFTDEGENSSRDPSIYKDCGGLA
jgi:hypothetical protein